MVRVVSYHKCAKILMKNRVKCHNICYCVTCTLTNLQRRSMLQIYTHKSCVNVMVEILNLCQEQTKTENVGKKLYQVDASLKVSAVLNLRLTG
jgi:hypothetical protein